MKKLILGKLLILITITQTLASVSVSVDKPSFYLNEVVAFTIKASGSNIKFPNIQNIAGNNIIKKSYIKNVGVNNNKITNSTSYSYFFQPKNSLIIPQFEVEINGKKYQTKKITLQKLKTEKNKSGADFLLTLKANKNSMFAGESIIIEAEFKVKKTIRLDKMMLDPIKVKGMDLTTDNKFIKSEDKNYIIHKIKYRAKAQTSGSLTIGSAIANIGTQVNTGFFSMIDWKKIYSNSINIKVKPLPDDLLIVGSFKINASIDKTTIKGGEAINLSIELTGNGNLADVEKFTFEIKNATIYSDEPSVSGNVLQQKVAIIADNNFVIPSIELKYFDNILNTVKIIKTKQIPITVVKSQSNNTNIQVPPQIKKVETKIIYKTINNNLKYYYLIFGLLFGAFFMWILSLIKGKIKKTKSLIQQIKSARTDKELFDLLLPINDKKLIGFIQKLEENIYKKASHKINKKIIINEINRTN